MSAVTKIFAGIALIVAGVLLIPVIGPVAAAQIIGIGVSLVLQGVISVIRGSPGSNNEISKVNVRIAEPIRWLHAGRARAGGAVLFAEFDDSGNLWYLVVHSDSILTNTPSYVFDEIPITVDGSGNVLTKDFRLVGEDKDPAETDGAGDPYVQIWTTTYTASNPTPPAISALASAFPTKWTSDHKLVGTTYSVVKMKALKIEDRFKLYKWRGAIGMGEPSVSIIGDWSEVHDPRDPLSDVNDPTTHNFSKNSELIWAWFRMHRYGRNKPSTEINWDKVTINADVCEQNVTGIAGTHERYECGIAMPEDRTRTECEQDILLTADAQLLFDETGKAYARVGYYETPTLALYRNRDIIAMESIEAVNGESETQGVIVRYTEPDGNYILQPSAPWYNPLYYVEGEAANFLTVDIVGCNDHNQAMRLAKAIGMRSAPSHRLAPTIGLRGLKAREERLITLQYDNTFSGDYEITTQVEVDEVGFMCSFGATPTDADQWTLTSGEEKPKPVIDDVDAIAAPSNATGVSVSYTNGRIEATFDPVVRDDVGYQFQHQITADLPDGIWIEMTVELEDQIAFSLPLPEGVNQSVRYRAISGSGRVSGWIDPVINLTIGVTIDEPSTLEVILFGGELAIQWRNPNNEAFWFCDVLGDSDSNIAGATTIGASVLGARNQIQNKSIPNLLTDYKYYWVKSFNQQGDTSNVGNPIIILDDMSTWSGDSAGAGSSVPVHTANYGDAPNGDIATTDRLQFTRGASGFSRRSKPHSVVSGQKYKFGLWVKGASSGYSFALRVDATDGVSLNLTTEFVYYSMEATAGSTTADIQLLLWSSITNCPLTTDVEVWGLHLIPVE